MPRGKSAKSLALIDAAAQFLAAVHPTSVRSVCYQLFNHGLIPHMGKNATDRVSEQLVYAREQGIIPWEWIVDETRTAERHSTWDDPEAFLDTASHSFRKNYWQFQPVRLEVWSEKGTVRGTLRPVLEQYAVTFRVMHGFGSATTLHEAAQESVAEPRPFVVLYCGDYDPSGMFMSEKDAPERLGRYGGAARLARIALEAGDVGPSSALPSFPAASKKNDARYKWFCANFGTQCWELDAMNPNELRARVRAHIESYISPTAWRRCQQAEAAESQSLKHFLASYQAAKERR